jgi:hypothetical protein
MFSFVEGKLRLISMLAIVEATQPNSVEQR